MVDRFQLAEEEGKRVVRCCEPLDLLNIEIRMLEVAHGCLRNVKVEGCMEPQKLTPLGALAPKGRLGQHCCCVCSAALGIGSQEVLARLWHQGWRWEAHMLQISKPCGITGPAGLEDACCNCWPMANLRTKANATSGFFKCVTCNLDRLVFL